ncbi:MAG: hypothetical protein A2Y76_12665 [Planctomycetes bacterium RBG_13_60_9]|nr:MAG: hypothetical protein A2Y76_12665 [Planctomycetes bacterium RBG_13_60_9]
MKVKLVILAGIIIGLIAAAFLLPLSQWLTALLERIGGLGPWGPVALGSLYVVSCVFLIPASIPTVAAGFLFGAVMGSLTAIIGGTAGACAAFTLGRTIARDWVTRRIARSRRFTALDDATGEHGFKIVLLSRLSPISPFIILNYFFGLTKVSFWDYTWATFIGTAPGMIMFVYLGAGLRSVAEVTAYARGQGQITTTHRVFFWGGLVVTGVVTVLLTHIARAALRKVAPAREPRSP